ncbi:MAG: proprotein convertase P-domain-containing protein [Rhodospirillaceae bacterium]|nr:proprotein convertase P-domain-containing protein [Rhodospirillaceae bacterium]
MLLEVDIDHEFPNDLGIHLVSPGGTRAVLNQIYNDTLALDEPGNLRWRVLGNAFYGETPNGDWQIEVFDAAEEDTGDLEAWRLRFYYGSHPEEEEEE